MSSLLSKLIKLPTNIPLGLKTTDEFSPKIEIRLSLKKYVSINNCVLKKDSVVGKIKKLTKFAPP